MVYAWNHLSIGSSCRKAPFLVLGQLVVIGQEGDKGPTQFPPAQRVTAQPLITIDKINWGTEPFDCPWERPVERKIKHGIQTEIEIIDLCRGIRTDIAVNGIIASDQFAKQEKTVLAQAFGILPEPLAKTADRQRSHVLDGIHPKSVNIRLAYPVAVRLD